MTAAVSLIFDTAADTYSFALKVSFEVGCFSATIELGSNQTASNDTAQAIFGTFILDCAKVQGRGELSGKRNIDGDGGEKGDVVYDFSLTFTYLDLTIGNNEYALDDTKAHARVRPGIIHNNTVVSPHMVLACQLC
jgi:hypothetical protein